MGWVEVRGTEASLLTRIQGSCSCCCCCLLPPCVSLQLACPSSRGASSSPVKAWGGVARQTVRRISVFTRWCSRRAQKVRKAPFKRTGPSSRPAPLPSSATLRITKIYFFLFFFLTRTFSFRRDGLRSTFLEVPFQRACFSLCAGLRCLLFYWFSPRDGESADGIWGADAGCGLS